MTHRDSANEPATRSSTPVQRRVSSRSLFNGAHELVIEHEGDRYRLRVTRNGKLILTK